MDLWMDLQFGNWTGILSIVTVFGALMVALSLLTLLYRKSHEKQARSH